MTIARATRTPWTELDEQNAICVVTANNITQTFTASVGEVVKNPAELDRTICNVLAATCYPGEDVDVVMQEVRP